MPRGFPIIGANRLQRSQQRQIEDLVQAEYATKGVGDKHFSEFASQQLGYRVTEGNVNRAREVFGIASTGRLHAKGGLTARVASIEARIEDFERKHEVLSQRIAVYLTGSR